MSPYCSLQSSSSLVSSSTLLSVFILFFFFFNDTATTEIYTLSLHDALPISRGRQDEGHHVPGHLLLATDHPLSQQVLEAQQAPQVVRQIDLAEVPRPLPTHSIEHHLNHALTGGQLRRVAGEQLDLVRRAIAVEHGDALAPSRRGRGVQLTQVCEGPVLRPPCRAHRLHQRVIAVGLAVLRAAVRLDEHAGQCARLRRAGEEGRSVLQANPRTRLLCPGGLTSQGHPKKRSVRLRCASSVSAPPDRRRSRRGSGS